MNILLHCPSQGGREDVSLAVQQGTQYLARGCCEIVYENEHPNAHLPFPLPLPSLEETLLPPLSRVASLPPVGIPRTGYINNYNSFISRSSGFFFPELSSHTNSAVQHRFMWSHSSFIAGITEHFTADYKVTHAGNDMSCQSEVKLQADFWAHPEDEKNSGRNEWHIKHQTCPPSC